MNLLIAIKTVVDDSRLIEPSADGKLVIGRSAALRIGRYDEFAIELALLLKDTNPEFRIEAVSVGGAENLPALERAVALGCDSSTLIRSDADRADQAAAVAGALCGFAAGRGFDLILTGALSEDYGRGVVGPLIAAGLGSDLEISAVKLSYHSNGLFACECEAPDGLMRVSTIGRGGVITVSGAPAPPRYPTLTNLLRAKKQQASEINIDELTDRPAILPSAPSAVYRTPAKPDKVKFIEGSPEIKAEELIELIRRR